MYNTVKEMHIALDLAIQQINSNRQQSISVDHKDMALNYAVLQFIETRTNPKTNIKQEGLEETTKRYDDLKDLKRTYVTKAFINNEWVVSPLPVDYYKYIEFGCGVAYSKYKSFDTKPAYIELHTLPFKDSVDVDEMYKQFKIKADDNLIFDASEYSGLPELYKADAKFMIINLVLEELNKIDGIDIYWENYYNMYHKDNFIIVNTKRDVYRKYTISYDRIQGIDSKYTLIENTVYSDISTNIKPVDLYSSDVIYSINDNYYHSANRHNRPLGYMEGSKIFVKQGDNFIVDKIHLSYYKKPRLISYRHNQSCEIQVNREIIDLAVKKLQSYMKDEGYQFTQSESQVIE